MRKIKKPKQQGLARRWAINILSVVAATIAVVETVFIFVVHEYYFSTVRQYLENKMSAITASFSSYSAGSYSDFELGARQYVEGFNERDKMEVQIIGPGGNVIMSTNGFLPDKNESYDGKETDLGGVTLKQGRLSSGEEVMTATTLIKSKQSDDITLGAVRIIVSLSDTSRQYTIIVLIGIGVGLVMFLVMVLSGTYFIRSIVNPIAGINKTARQIAAGDFDARIEPSENPKDDEISRLGETINYMASELGSTEKMKNEFISSVSHELRTPLTAIKGWGETVLSSIDDPTITKKGIDVIISEAERLSVIVEDLLDFSRMQSGNLKYNMESCDIVAEVSEAVMTLTDTAKKQGVFLEYNEPESMPAVVADAGRMQQVFVNIISNALKYTSAGGHILVDVKEEIGYVLIMVSDNGRGIPEADLDKVKQKFYKAEGSVRGSGIGLALADEIVKNHGGRLEISSTENIGTTVSIMLPQKPGNEN